MVLQRGHCCPGRHLIFEAVKRGNRGALELLLEEGSEGVDETCMGRRPLQKAIEMCLCTGDGGYQLAELLLQKGADPTCARVLQGDSPLRDAGRRGNTAAVQLLLDYGADPNTASKNGHTTLHTVCMDAPVYPSRAHLQVVDLLLRHGASPVAADALGGNLPRTYAQEEGLRQKLARAETWWTRRSLALSCRSVASGAQGPGGLLQGATMPDVIVEAILTFACGAAGRER
jgi:ankyrin repeat protein